MSVAASTIEERRPSHATSPRVVSFVLKRHPGELYGGDRSAIALFAGLSAESFTAVLNVDDASAAELRGIGLDVEVLPVFDLFTGFRKSSLIGKACRLLTLIGYNLRAIHLLKRLAPDVVHLNDVAEYMLLAPALAVTRRPTVLHVRCELSMRRRHELSMATASRVLSVSRGIQEAHAARASRRLSGRIEARSRVVPNGIDLAEVDAFIASNHRAQVRDGFDIESEDIVVLLVGSLEPRKGQLEFLTGVAPELSSSAKRTRVILVGGTKDGDESYERACRRAAARLKAPRVTFVGYRPSVFDWLLACDLVVLPSRAEGLPRTALEAGAFSRPVVGTQIPGMADAVIDNETGFVIERENHGAFGAAIVRLADDEMLRSQLGAQARTLVEQHFDIELCRERFQEVLKGCTRD